jgi:hypothetical protein
MPLFLDHDPIDESVMRSECTANSIGGVCLAYASAWLAGVISARERILTNADIDELVKNNKRQDGLTLDPNPVLSQYGLKGIPRPSLGATADPGGEYGQYPEIPKGLYIIQCYMGQERDHAFALDFRGNPVRVADANMGILSGDPRETGADAIRDVFQKYGESPNGPRITNYQVWQVSASGGGCCAVM